MHLIQTFVDIPKMDNLFLNIGVLIAFIVGVLISLILAIILIKRNK